VLKSHGSNPEFGLAETYRKRLFSDERTIKRLDLGAGSRGQVKPPATISISRLARRSSLKKKEARMLFRLIRKYSLNNILELGTCLGMGSMYFSLASKHGKVLTIEGCPETAAAAKELLSAAGRENIEVLTGGFREKLPSALEVMPSPDLVFIDGDHRKESCLEYLGMILPHIGPQAVVVLHDIHWSPGMEEAWATAKSDPAVTVSVDLFGMGLLFFRKELSKEDFVLRY
jgi:predicted O-methyltransferase YrrM